MVFSLGARRRRPRLDRRPFSDRTDLYRTNARQRPSGREIDGLVEVLDVDEHIPAEMLPRFGERSVGQEAFAVAHPDGRCRGRRMERVAPEVPSARYEILSGPHLAPVSLLALGEA